jgi:hypothetical protein
LLAPVIRNKLYTEINQKVENILQISLQLRYYDLYNDAEEFKRIKLMIFNNYFLCWSYILIISIHTLPQESIFLLLNLFPITLIEPFSDTI